MKTNLAMIAGTFAIMATFSCSPTTSPPHLLHPTPTTVTVTVSQIPVAGCESKGYRIVTDPLDARKRGLKCIIAP